MIADCALVVKDSRLKCGVQGTWFLGLGGLGYFYLYRAASQSGISWGMLLLTALLTWFSATGVIRLARAVQPRVRFTITQHGIWTKDEGTVEWAALVSYYSLILSEKGTGTTTYLVFVTVGGREIEVGFDLADADLGMARLACSDCNSNVTLRYEGEFTQRPERPPTLA